ncbi:MAG: glycosyltransferase [Rhodospirillales bacterium]|nr:glycosyltransferase [Rhodospirillales bacterium]
MINSYIFRDLMKTPQVLHLRGVCPQYGVFTLNFVDADERQPLHLAFRVSARQLAINENLRGNWGEEIRVDGIDFPLGLPFNLDIELRGPRRLRISMNGVSLAELDWRADITAGLRLDMVDVEFSLFRDDREIKSLPELTEGDDVPADLPADASDDAARETTMDQLCRHVVELRSAQQQAAEDMGQKIDQMAAQLAELQKVTVGVAASVQALIALDVNTIADSRPAAAPAKAKLARIEPPRGQMIEDQFVKGWGDWRHHQGVKLGNLGLFDIQQDRSTPGIERAAVAVEPNSFYEFTVSGHFKTEHKKVFIAAYDPDLELNLTPTRYVKVEAGRSAQRFMTSARTKRLILRVLVEQPKVGDQCRIESTKLELLGRADLYAPARDETLGEEKIVANMASVKGREAMVVDAVHSLYPFVDKIRLYLNQYAEVPSALKLPRVEIVRSQQFGDDGDAGKFFWVENADFNLNLVCDDDLIYPVDYVPEMVAALKRYGNKAVVGLHGALLKQPLAAYHDEKSRHVRRFVHANSEDCQVHVLGTGVMLYDRRTLQLKRRDFQFRNMADMWLAEKAQEQGVPAICIARPRNWVIENRVPGGVPTIYDASHRKQGNDFDTGVLQTAIARKNWPITMKPTVVNGERRKKIVMSITTWNRVDYLKDCIESFEKTRSTKYDWVLIVADDGSTDGTLAYLDQLVLPHEVHIIRNKSRYACGQTNTIFDLCQKIGFDFAFKIDDDILFKKRGWDTLYIEAAFASGYPHLCHRNWQHFTGLKRRTNPNWAPPPPHIDASGKCETIVGVWECDGCLFTFSPEMIQKVGYCDEANFPIRGQWHIDYSVRAARAGFNDPTHFYDARDSNQYIELQANKPTYRCSLPWGDAYKKTKDPAELERRDRVMRDESRIFVPEPSKQVASGNPTAAVPVTASSKPAPAAAASGPAIVKRKLLTVNQAFSKVYVMNLDRRPDRLALVDRQARKLGIQYTRVPAVDGSAKPHIDEFQAYAKQKLVDFPEGARRLTKSKDFYQGYDSPVARTAFVEQKLKAKAIRSAGAWGYLKSYIAILQDAIAAGHESILILDDDPLFHKNFPVLFDAAMRELPKDWKIVQLGALQYDWGEDWIAKHSQHLYRCNGSSVGSHATGIHRSVIPALLHEAMRFDLPLDVGALCKVKRSFAEKCFTILPNLIIQDTTESDIASSDVQQAEGQKRANVYRWKLEDYYAPAPGELKAPMAPAPRPARQSVAAAE